jgi:hypothetical protein
MGRFVALGWLTLEVPVMWLAAATEHEPPTYLASRKHHDFDFMRLEDFGCTEDENAAIAAELHREPKRNPLRVHS